MGYWDYTQWQNDHEDFLEEVAKGQAEAQAEREAKAIAEAEQKKIELEKPEQLKFNLEPMTEEEKEIVQ